MKKHSHILALAFLSVLFLTVGCGGGDSAGDSQVIAQFKDKTLTQKQLDFYVPDGVPSEDSARFAKQFVKRWIREQAVMDRAISQDETLSERVEYKVEDYRAKLIMHEYHTGLIEESLDKDVPLAEIQAYYEQNKDNFRSKETLYSYFYLVSTTSDGLDQAARWMRAKDEASITKLRNWAAENAMEAKLDSSFAGETQVNNISKGYYGSLQKAGKGQLIRWNGVIQGVRRRYMFKMIEIVDSGDYLPISMCEDKIKGLLINERKLKLIEETEQKILQDAEAKNFIK